MIFADPIQALVAEMFNSWIALSEQLDASDTEQAALFTQHYALGVAIVSTLDTLHAYSSDEEFTLAQKALKYVQPTDPRYPFAVLEVVANGASVFQQGKMTFGGYKAAAFN